MLFFSFDTSTPSFFLHFGHTCKKTYGESLLQTVIVQKCLTRTVLNFDCSLSIEIALPWLSIWPMCTVLFVPSTFKIALLSLPCVCAVFYIICMMCLSFDSVFCVCGKTGIVVNMYLEEVLVILKCYVSRCVLFRVVGWCGCVGINMY